MATNKVESKIVKKDTVDKKKAFSISEWLNTPSKGATPKEESKEDK